MTLRRPGSSIPVGSNPWRREAAGEVSGANEHEAFLFVPGREAGGQCGVLSAPVPGHDLLCGPPMSALVLPAAVATAVVLLFAGTSKLRTLTVFREQIADYGLLPYSVTPLAAALATGLEIVGGSLLLVPDYRRFGSGLAAALLVVFLCVLVLAFIKGRQIACGCLGGQGPLDTIGLQSVARTGILAGLALIAGLPTDVPMDAPHVYLGASLVLAIIFIVPEMIRLAVDTRQSKAALSSHEPQISAGSSPA